MTTIAFLAPQSFQNGDAVADAVEGLASRYVALSRGGSAGAQRMILEKMRALATEDSVVCAIRSARP